MGRQQSNKPGRWGWFATKKDASRSWFDDEQVGDRPVGATLPPADPPDGPVRVRFFVDDVAGIALWPDARQEYGWPPRPAFEEEVLPMSKSLRDHITSWLDEYTEAVGNGDRSFNGIGHDRRGYQLSCELQDELGAGYLVRYGFHTAEVRHEVAERSHD